MKIIEDIKESKLKLYYIASFFIVISLIFFLNSNKMLNDDYNLLDTKYNEKIGTQECNVMLIDKEYNPDTNLIKFVLKVKNQDDECNISSEVVEKSHTDKKIETELIKVTDENYVAYAVIPHKWKVVSLRIKKTAGRYKANTMKMYADSEQTKSNNSLTKLDRGTLMCEFIDKDISSIEKNIKDLDKQVNQKKEAIKKQETEIRTIEADKVFQTKNEQEETDENVSGINKQIEYVKLDITDILKQKDEFKEKISKLELKKQYYTN